MLPTKIQFFPKFSAIFAGMKTTRLKVWVLLVSLGFGLFCLAQNDAPLSRTVTNLPTGLSTEETREWHEAKLRQDSSTYASNCWLGNYYTLKGNEQLKVVEKAYASNTSSNRMQIAAYKQQLVAVYHDYYAKAEACLNRVNRTLGNEYLQSLSEKIETYKVRIGLAEKPSKRKKRLANQVSPVTDNKQLP